MTIAPTSTVLLIGQLPRRVVRGTGAARDALAGEVDLLGGRRVLVVVTEQERPLAEELVAPFAERVAAVFTDVRPHVPVENARRAREVADEVGADLVLSVGGGSTTGTAKAVALDGDGPPRPILAVPTTFAGSEMTPIWGMTDGGRKTTGRSPRVVSSTVVHDPELCLSLPHAVAAPSALNAMAHCVAALEKPDLAPALEAWAERGVATLADGLRRLGPDGPLDREVAGALLDGAGLAGMVLSLAGTGTHHRLCHVLGGAFDLPHADLHAILLPHVVAATTPDERADTIALALGAGNAAAGLADLLEGTGGPRGLQEVGLGPERLESALSLLADDQRARGPVGLDESTLRVVLTGAVLGLRPGVAADARGAA